MEYRYNPQLLSLAPSASIALMDKARLEEDKDGKMCDMWTCRNCDAFPHVNCFTENFSFTLFISFWTYVSWDPT